MTDIKEDKPKSPIIKDMSGDIDSFKRSQGWSEPESVAALPKAIKKAGKRKKVTQQETHKPKKVRPKIVKQTTPSTDWSPKQIKWDDDEFEDEIYKPTKNELIKRKKELEIAARKKERESIIRDQDIYNALVRSMNREIIYPMYNAFGWAMIAKLTKLNVHRSVAGAGFQPYEQQKEEKLCAITLLHWEGDGPEHGTMARSIVDIGCPKVFISRADEVKDILRRI